MRSRLSVAALFCAVLTYAVEARAAETQRPNFIVINIDDK